MSLLYAVVSLLSVGAHAIDPFTIAAVVNTTASVVSSVSETAGEVAASADAFSELYSEIDSDADVGEDGQKIIREVREIEELASEVGYTKEELEDLSTNSSNPESARKFSTVLRSITKAVRAGKNVSRLVMKLDQKAKIAQVEVAQIQREQLMVSLKQLRLEHEKELRETKEQLRGLKDKRDQIAVMRREEAKSGAKVFKNTGILSFPKQDSVVEEALKVAMDLKRSLLAMVLFVFFVRLVAYQFGMFGLARYGDLVRDTIICMLLFSTFPDLIRACLALSSDLSNSIGRADLNEIKPGSVELPSTIEVMVKTRIFFEWLYDWIKYIAFFAAKFLTNFGLALMIVIFPIVIFCSQMLNFSIAWPIFLAGFIALSLWPLFWNATGSFAAALWNKNNASFSDQFATVLFALIQFFSPYIATAVLKGQSMSKAISGAAETMKSTASGGLSFLWNTAKSGLHGTTGNRDAMDEMKNSSGKTLGRVLSYVPNQVISRSIAGAKRSKSAYFGVKNDKHNKRGSVGGYFDAHNNNKRNSFGSAAIEGLKGMASNHRKPVQRNANTVAHLRRTINGIGRTDLVNGVSNV